MIAADGRPRRGPAVESSAMSESIVTPDPATTQHVSCALCDAAMPVHASYVVRIDVFADPTLPPMNSDDLAAFDFEQALAQIADEASGMTADDLQDGVHRRFEYRLCPKCQRGFLANPLGKPRSVRAGKN